MMHWHFYDNLKFCVFNLFKTSLYKYFEIREQTLGFFAHFHIDKFNS